MQLHLFLNSCLFIKQCVYLQYINIHRNKHNGVTENLLAHQIPVNLLYTPCVLIEEVASLSSFKCRCVAKHTSIMSSAWPYINKMRVMRMFNVEYA